MSIELTDRYKLIFEEHHYASDFRTKIVQAWCLSYAGLAAGLGWTEANAKEACWVLSALACVITAFMWAADVRNRTALDASKKVGQAIEEDKWNNIPEGQRFFSSLTSDWLTHSLVIDVLAGLMLAVLTRASIFFKCTGGNLNLPSDIICWAIGGCALGAAFYVYGRPHS